MSCRGHPRDQYERVALLVSPRLTVDDVCKIIRLQAPLGPVTHTPSADDAGVGDLDSRTVIAADPEGWANPGAPGGLTQGWYDQYYPGVRFWPLIYDNDVQLEGRLLAYDLKRRGLVLITPSSHTVDPAVTQEFGVVTSYGHHMGLDLRGSWAEWHDRAVAAYPGKIIWAGHLDNGLGTQVHQEIITPDGRKIVLRYGHLVAEAPYVSDGDIVEAGRPLGKLDNSGASDGDHLHFEIRVTDDQVADPELLIEFEPAPTAMARGIHGLATPERPPHDRWGWIVDELHAMGMTHYVSLCHEVDWCKFLVDHEITPIVRFMHQQQMPDRLHPAFRAFFQPLYDVGVRIIQQGINEGNLAPEWRPEWQALVSWQNTDVVKAWARNYWLDIEEGLNVGLKMAFGPFAPTERGIYIPHPTASSVMWPEVLLPYLIEYGGDRFVEALRSGVFWVATHHSPFTYPLDYSPDQPHGKEDMCLLGVNHLVATFKRHVGFVPKTFIRTEGGAHSPAHLMELGFAPTYNDDEWGEMVVATYDYEERHTVLNVACNWLFGAWGNPQWAAGAWYDANWQPRSPVAAMKAARG